MASVEIQIIIAAALIAALLLCLPVSTPMLTVVCSTPRTPERTRHMRRLCDAEGLYPHAFTTELGLFVDKESAECADACVLFDAQIGHLCPVYAAHYLTYLAALRYFLDRTDAGLLLLLEDDIVRVEGPNVSVHDAIGNAPEFGVLFLEYCYAACDRPTWSNDRYARGYEAYNTGACVFTRRGARSLLEFARKNGPTIIDHLTRAYSKQHSEDVLYVRPPMFMQDRGTFATGVAGAETVNCPVCEKPPSLPAGHD
jgi:hypothetical protein